MRGGSVGLEVAAVLCLVAGRAHAGLLGGSSGGGIGGAMLGSAFGTPGIVTLAGTGNAAVIVAGTFRAPKRKPESDDSGKGG